MPLRPVTSATRVMSRSAMIWSTTRLTRTTLGSGAGSRASRNASAAATSRAWPAAARRSATRRSPAGPKTSATATRRSVRVATGAPRNGWKPAGRNLIPKARPSSSSSRVNRPVSTPMTPERSRSATRCTDGWGRVCWVWGSRPLRSQLTVQKCSTSSARAGAGRVRVTSKRPRPDRRSSTPPGRATAGSRRVCTSLPSVGGPTLAVEVIETMTGTTGKAGGGFTIKAWDEQPYAELDGAPKLTHARVTTTYGGDLEGEGTSELVMAFDQDDATYAGYERVVGSLGGRSGSFVLRLDGGFEDGAARTTWTVVEGTGTGDLAGLRGEGGYLARHGEAEVAYELRWSLA